MLQRFSIWLDKKTIQAMKEISKEADRPVGWLIRKAVEDFVEQRRAKSKQ
jgi:predicted transcriptional regulator